MFLVCLNLSSVHFDSYKIQYQKNFLSGFSLRKGLVFLYSYYEHCDIYFMCKTVSRQIPFYDFLYTEGSQLRYIIYV